MKDALTINKTMKNLNKDNDLSCPLIKAGDKKIISVISNKGGVGKTSIACCLSLCLSKELNKKTLLLELDCSPGDFGTLFDISEEQSLEMAIRFINDYKKYIKCINSNLDVLKGMPDPIIAENIKSEEVGNFLEVILKDYDYIILDTQTVLNGILLDFLKASGLLLVISDPTMESIARVSNYLELLNSRFKINRDKFKIIINKRKTFSFLQTWEISRILNFPIDSFIYFDRRFNKSNILLNESKILGTRLFKQVSKTIRSIDTEFSNVK